ncbi:hypothetical protein [environmental halophage 1 AAJ-2005]|nr:hypothetical protein [environmental halophage 1 AAJ-2005]
MGGSLMLDDHPDDTTDPTDGDELHQHDNWQSGDPCPECGHEFMYITQVSNETYKHTGGDYEHTDWGAYREDLKVTCKDCGAVLFRHPAMDSLSSV